MIIPTPPASVKPQHTGESTAAQLPPGYSPPTQFEQARLAYDGKHDHEHEWQEDHKDSTGLYWDYQVEEQPHQQAELLVAETSRRSAAYRSSVDGARTSSFASTSPADSLVNLLLHHATLPPRLTVQIRGTTAGPSAASFDIMIDASSEVEAGIEGGRRAVLHLAEEKSGRVRRSRRAPEDPECGRGGFLGGVKAEKGCAGDLNESGLPAFVHPSSLADINSPGASLLHPPQLYQSLFVDVAEVLSSGLYPAAEYPQHLDATQQHEERAKRVYRAVEEFHQSTSPFKQLVCEKEVFGWDLRRVRAGLETSIRSIADVSSLDITFHCDRSPIVFRPDNLITRIFTLHPIFKLILSILLIYPILLLLSQLHTRRTPPTHLRLSYPLISWRLLPPHSATQSPEQLGSALVKRRPTTVARLPRSLGSAAEDVEDVEDEEEWVVLVGTMEGEWIEKCRERLRSELGKVAKGGSREK